MSLPAEPKEVRRSAVGPSLAPERCPTCDAWEPRLRWFKADPIPMYRDKPAPNYMRCPDPWHSEREGE